MPYRKETDYGKYDVVGQSKHPHLPISNFDLRLCRHHDGIGTQIAPVADLTLKLTNNTDLIEVH